MADSVRAVVHTLPPPPRPLLCAQLLAHVRSGRHKARVPYTYSKSTPKGQQRQDSLATEASCDTLACLFLRYTLTCVHSTGDLRHLRSALLRQSTSTSATVPRLPLCRATCAHEPAW